MLIQCWAIGIYQLCYRIAIKRYLCEAVSETTHFYRTWFLGVLEVRDIKLDISWLRSRSEAGSRLYWIHTCQLVSSIVHIKVFWFNSLHYLSDAVVLEETIPGKRALLKLSHGRNVEMRDAECLAGTLSRWDLISHYHPRQLAGPPHSPTGPPHSPTGVWQGHTPSDEPNSSNYR